MNSGWDSFDSFDPPSAKTKTEKAPSQRRMSQDSKTQSKKNEESASGWEHAEDVETEKEKGSGWDMDNGWEDDDWEFSAPVKEKAVSKLELSKQKKEARKNKGH